MLGCEEGLRVLDSDQKSRRHSIYHGWNLMEGEGEERKRLQNALKVTHSESSLWATSGTAE